MPQGIGTALSMLVCVLVILALTYWCTKLIARRGMPGMPGLARARWADELAVLCQLGLGRGERLVLVRVHQRCLLLGVVAGNISLITELTSEEAENWLKKEEAEPESTTFADVLRENLFRKK